MKKLIKKLAKFILVSQPRDFVKVNVSQISYGKILEGKRILITGGGRGLEYAMAKKFISEGAYVVIVGRNENVLKESQKKLGERCKYIVFDVSNVEEIPNMLERGRVLMGDIDILVSNAGISLHEGNFKNVTIESFDSQINTNFRASYFIGKFFLQTKMNEKKEGNLLYVSSNTSGESVDIPYGLTKAAINSMVRGFARRVYKYGIRVNAIAPGVTLTDMTRSFAIQDDGNMAYNAPSGRTFLPEEVAELANFIVSDAAKCINGEIVFCDAGNHLKTQWLEERW